MPTIPATTEAIISYFLYEDTTPPSDLTDESLIRPAGREVAVDVPLNDYMAGPGRFALGPLSALVRAFFSTDPSYPSLAPGIYSKADLENKYGIRNGDRINFQQYEFDDGNPDYAERTFLWNSSRFELSNSVQFEVLPSGERRILNYAVLPRGTENYDFVSNNIVAKLGNLYLQPRIDPSKIGRTVIISFSGGGVPLTTYTRDMYQDDVRNLDLWFTGPQLGRLSAEIDEILANLSQAGITKFLDAHSRPILYGTTAGDTLSAAAAADSGKYPTLAGFVGNGVVLIGGSGTDTLTGGANGDALYGGSDGDTLIGAAGNDELFGAESSDTLDGGADNDVLDGGTGADLMTGGKGDDWFVVDDAKDAVLENKGEGTDTVASYITYTISASQNVENLTLLGEDDINGTGDDSDNVINGNVGNNILKGAGGNDKMYGSDGADVIIGGLGNDILWGASDKGADGNYVDDGKVDILDGGLEPEGQEGTNIYNIGAGDVIVDFKAGDKLFYNGVELTGGQDVAAFIREGALDYPFPFIGKQGEAYGFFSTKDTHAEDGFEIYGQSETDNTTLFQRFHEKDAGLAILLPGSDKPVIIFGVDYWSNQNHEKEIYGYPQTPSSAGFFYAQNLATEGGGLTFKQWSLLDNYPSNSGSLYINQPQKDAYQRQISLFGEGGGGGALPATFFQHGLAYSIGTEYYKGLEAAAGYNFKEHTWGPNIKNPWANAPIPTGQHGGRNNNPEGGNLNPNGMPTPNLNPDSAGGNAGGSVPKQNEPLVIDLNGDGLSLTALAGSNAFFDLDGDGFAQRTAWVTGGDGLLAMDRNGNGVIDDVNELFGPTDITGGDTKDGFETLSKLDSNGDGKITSADAKFNDLRVWVDADGDGLTDAGELKTLSDVGIVSFSLTTTASGTTINGNLVSETATYTKSNNTTGTVGDAWLLNSATETVNLNPESVPAWMMALPGMRGYGRVDGLRATMAKDSDLLAAVVDLGLAATTPSDLFSQIAGIVNLWAGGTKAGQFDRGAFVDGQHLADLENLAGRSYVLPADPNNKNPDLAGGLVLENAWDEVVEAVGARVLVQGLLAPAFTGVTYMWDSDSFTGTMNAATAVATIASKAPAGNGGDAFGYWKLAVAALDEVAGDVGVSTSTYDSALSSALTAAGFTLPLATLRAMHVRGAFDQTSAQSLFGFEGFFPQYFITGSASTAVFGGKGNDTIIAGGGNDILDGDAGDDSIAGAAGSDTYRFGIGSGKDQINDTGGVAGDTDVVEIKAGVLPADLLVYRDPADANNLVLQIAGTADTLTVIGHYAAATNGIDSIKFSNGTTWTRAFFQGLAISGTTGNDTNIVGTANNDFINGLAGADKMSGGAGSDTYVVDNGGDVVTEASGAGWDLVLSSVSHSLAANVEGLQLTGTSDINGTGNSADNVITGNQGNNTLDGFTGNDKMFGGEGTDTYIVDSLGDSVTEVEQYQNDDTVKSSVTWTLGAFVENLILTGTGNINGTGTDEDNVITGTTGNNTLTGGAGDDQINGNGGVDTLIGGTGSDAYTVDSTTDVVVEDVASGNDTIQSSVTWTLGANIENLTLLGASALNGSGNADDNVITGNSAANSLAGGAGNDRLYGGGGNDTLDGGLGADSMSGGAGNDTYIVDDKDDRVDDEGVDAGNVDTVLSSASSFTLGGFSEIENLTLTGTGNINGTGNGGNNVITGNSGANVLDGSSGSDSLIGGAGNDTYVVDDSLDAITELAGGGTDTVLAQSSYTLAANVENLTLTGSDINGTGNGLDNIITGSVGTNSLSGGAGADVLTGGGGTDTLVGGDGADTYQFSRGDGQDLIQNADADSGADKLKFGAGITYDQLWFTRTSNDLVITVIGTTDTTTVQGWYSAAVNQIDRIEVIGGGYILAADVETLRAAMAPYPLPTQTSLDPTTKQALLASLATGWHITGGTSGNDTLNGTSADDTIDGGAGNDTLNGGNGNDLLIGGTGNDSLVGGVGDDVYDVDAAGDVVTEAASAGTDTVRSSITYSVASLANVENVTLTGSAAINATGNAAVNVLIGNGGANTLDGGTGADTLVGGAGDDLYVVDNAGDAVTEAAGEGTDTINASVSYSLAATPNVENLTLTGTGAIDATGNAGVNTLTGNSGANTLDGGLGADSLAGGGGNDTYVVDNAGDVVTEGASAGTDTVVASMTYSIATLTNIENVTLVGDVNSNATGNAGNNVLIGNVWSNTLTGAGGNDTLDGGANNDTLIGGAGNDTYVVEDQGDVITEIAGEGTDTVQSSINFSLENLQNVENVTLLGVSAINATGNTGVNVLTGNSVANTLDGGGGNDTLSGGSGNDVLIGGTGNDSLAGGDGDDLYDVDAAGDVVTEAASAGTDTVRSSVTYSLASLANVENITLTGPSAINATGNAGVNVLTGNGWANTLDGGAGADSLVGGAGNDTYVVDDAGDVVTEAASEGTDTVNASVSYSLAATPNVENLTLTGSGAINATGNDGVNVLTGNSGANTLDGGLGADTLVGGTGDDTYVVDNAGDVVTEAASAGTDTVSTAMTYSIAGIANLENITLTGIAAVNATGNTLNNMLVGNSGVNTLTGSAGNDVLDGGADADKLVGGTGNDTYVVDNASDVVTENASEGTDTVQSLLTYSVASLANVENITLIGTAAINATGNAGVNQLVGNGAANTLDGGTGEDTLAGGAGDDSYVVNSAGDTVVENLDEGVDTVQSSITYTLGANVENVTLTGSTAIDATGNALNNVLTGNGGANTLTGGKGDDIYVVGAGDIVAESADEGRDTVQSALTYTLGANVENLTLTGFTAINGTGNSLDNVLLGNGATNILTGGLGDDVYGVDNTTDGLVENAAEGTDTVVSTVTWTLAANFENLALVGENAIDGVGNAADNLLGGNDYKNTLTGGAGKDVLRGGVGNDVLIGGDGADTYLFERGDEADVIQNSDSDGGADKIKFDLRIARDQLWLTRVGNDLVISIVGALDAVTVQGWYSATVNQVDRIELWDGTYMLAADVESLRTAMAAYPVPAVGATDLDPAVAAALASALAASWHTAGGLGGLTLTGTSGNDVLTGGANNDTLNGLGGDDTLDGGAGADTLVGGTGNDTYVVDHAGDVVTENAAEGTDVVQSAITYVLGASVENLALTGSTANNGTGNALDNTITGNSAANVLDGGTGADTLIGGAGNDTYVVDNAGDVVTESGTDTADLVQSSITYTLGSTVENLTLTGTAAINGTGNALANTVTGNSGANVLDGGTGADTLIGGAGNDTYVVDNAGDVVTESGTDTADLVQSSVTYTLSSTVENLTLTGTAAINGTGNALANTVTGNSGANVLDGSTGADTLIGGAGNDTYVVDNVGDVVTESGNDTADLVQSSITYTLGSTVENLTLTGTAAINGTGNGLANTVTGNSGANVLNGGTGADTLIGGAGNDTYVVDNAGDVVSESGTDTADLVQSSVTYSLGSSVENLTLTGTAAINGTGNALANTVTGNSGANVLDGGTGADTLIGGAGNDTYVVDNAGDVVTESGTDTADLVQSSITYTLGSTVENLTLTGTAAINGNGNVSDNVIVGNSAVNTLTGAAGNDTLDGGGGGDTLIGGTGNDTYVVDSAGDVVTENAAEGTDLVQSGVTYTLATNLENLALTGSSAINGTGNGSDNLITGNSAANTLTGAAGNDTLDGGAGADTLVGGTDNDTYVVDNAGDIVTENSAEGTDLVQSGITYTLAANVENLTLTGSAAINGTGNSLANTLAGNSGANTLDGGIGADTLIGGAGNDTYVIDNTGDVITENGTDTNDTVLSSLVNTTLGSNLENLTLTRADWEVNGTGNSLDNIIIGQENNNTLTGGAGNDTLDGKLGDDLLVGGTGDDLYYTDSWDDVITENAGEGIDSVISSVGYVFAANVENATLVGTAGDATGNALDNKIIGSAADNYIQGKDGNDDLNGGAGNDILQGGNGVDIYRFDRGGGTDEWGVWDSDGSADKAIFGANIATDQLWFRTANYDGDATADDLEISIIGTNDKVWIDDWFGSSADKAERIEAAGKYAQAADVQALVNAMSAFSPPPLGQTTLDSTRATALAPTLAASWHT